MIETPDTLSATRYRIKYRGWNVYVVVSLMDGRPVELFVEFPFKPGQDDTALTYSGLNTITRLASQCLLSEDITLERVIDQLEKSSIKKSDIPSILSSILKKYSLHHQEAPPEKFEEAGVDINEEII